MSKLLKQWTMALAVGCIAGWGWAAEEVQLASSWLERAGYDAESQTLTVRMKNSSDVYEFKGVPEEVYRNFLEAESKGAYFATKIQNVYPTTRR